MRTEDHTGVKIRKPEDNIKDDQIRSMLKECGLVLDDKGCIVMVVKIHLYMMGRSPTSTTNEVYSRSNKRHQILNQILGICNSLQYIKAYVRAYNYIDVALSVYLINIHPLEYI